MHPVNVLILPGWRNSGPGHWQSRWEQTYAYRRVEQHDWLRPLRGDWIARLEDVLLGCDGPAVLVAHSLGCIQVAAWAAHSQNTHRVQGALLVAPPDIERADVRQLLPSWAPLPRQRLPFKALLVASRNDPWCAWEQAHNMAHVWGVDLQDAGAGGHLNAENGLADWPHGQQLLAGLFAAVPGPHPVSAAPTALAEKA